MYNKKLIKELMAMTYDIVNPKTEKLDPSSARLRIVDQAKRGYMRSYTREDIEDAFMDAIMYVIERCKRDEEYAKTASVRSVTYRMRGYAQRYKFKDNGYTQRGTVPKGGRTLHIGNLYDKQTGENQIEKMAYNENGEVMVGT